MVEKLPEPEDKGDRKLLEDVEARGWHVVKIMESEGQPGWAFTVGLPHSFDHPEVIVFGLGLDTMHVILNEIGELIKNGARFEPGAVSPDILDGYDCQFQSVAPEWFGPFLGYAMWFHNGEPFTVLQCQWPDKAGEMPGDPDFAEALRPLQPLLNHAEPDAAKAEGLLKAWGLLE